MAARMVYKRPGQKPVTVDLDQRKGARCQRVEALVGGSFDRRRAPSGCPVPGVWLYGPVAAGRLGVCSDSLGLAGPVIAGRFAPSGEAVDMTDAQLAAVADWLEADRSPLSTSIASFLPAAPPQMGLTDLQVSHSGPVAGTFRLPLHAVRADAYEAAGGDFSRAQLHFTGLQGDRAERALVQRLVDTYSGELVAYADERTPGHTGFPPEVVFSLQLLFAETPAGKAAMSACLRGYEDGPRAERRGQSQGKRAARRHSCRTTRPADTSDDPHITYYDLPPGGDPGFVYYASRVHPGLECRVLDCVRDISDLTGDRSSQALGFLGGPPARRYRDRLFAEAVAVSLAAPVWIDRLMTCSPFRDAASWAAEGRQAYDRERAARRQVFVSCRGNAGEMLLEFRGRRAAGN